MWIWYGKLINIQQTWPKSYFSIICTLFEFINHGIRKCIATRLQTNFIPQQRLLRAEGERTRSFGTSVPRYIQADQEVQLPDTSLGALPTIPAQSNSSRDRSTPHAAPPDRCDSTQPFYITLNWWTEALSTTWSTHQGPTERTFGMQHLHSRKSCNTTSTSLMITTRRQRSTRLAENIEHRDVAMDTLRRPT